MISPPEDPYEDNDYTEDEWEDFDDDDEWDNYDPEYDYDDDELEDD